jgi:hypothetical protein
LLLIGKATNTRRQTDELAAALADGRRRAERVADLTLDPRKKRRKEQWP